jgi:hypothetical protein
MTRTPRQAAYKAIMDATSGEIWGDERYSDLVEPGGEYPFLRFWRIGGGQDNDRPGSRSAELLLGIVVVSDQYSDIESGAQRITALFDNQGRLEDNTVAGVSDWHIQTITQEMSIYSADKVGDTRTVWQEGHQYRFVMEEI